MYFKSRFFIALLLSLRGLRIFIGFDGSAILSRFFRVLFAEMENNSGMIRMVFRSLIYRFYMLDGL
jgi:hypothetical protein